MSKIIAVKIDVTKIDKTKLFEGKKGAKYLDAVLIENKDGTDQYGNNFMVTQSVSKEERLAGGRGAILGNAKYVGGGSKPQAKPAVKKSPIDDADVPNGDDSSEVPF